MSFEVCKYCLQPITGKTAPTYLGNQKDWICKICESWLLNMHKKNSQAKKDFIVGHDVYGRFLYIGDKISWTGASGVDDGQGVIEYDPERAAFMVGNDEDATELFDVLYVAVKIALREGYKKGYSYGELLGKRLSVYKESDRLLVGHDNNGLGGWA